jgi:hypothetical protein
MKKRRKVMKRKKVKRKEEENDEKRRKSEEKRKEVPCLGSLPTHLDQGAFLDKLSGGSQENLRRKKEKKK